MPADEPDRHFYEGAVRLAYAMHLLRTEPVREVRIHPEGRTLAKSISRAGSRSAVFGGWRPLAPSSPARSRTPRGAGSWFIRDQGLATSPPTRKDLIGSTRALVRTGGWSAILEVWRARFPDLVDGLPVEIVDAMGERTRRAHAKWSASSTRGKQNRKTILSNLECLVSQATRGNEFAMRHRGTRVRLPEGLVLRPEFVMGPIRTGDQVQPTLIVRTTNRYDKTRDRPNALLYRSARGVEHILLISSNEVEIEHFQRIGGRWKSDLLKAGDSISISRPELSIQINALYASTEI